MTDGTNGISRRKRRRKSLDIPSLRRVVSDAIREVEHLLETTTDAQVKLRAVHALSQAVQTYLKVLEQDDLRARLDALEERVSTQYGIRA